MITLTTHFTIAVFEEADTEGTNPLTLGRAGYLLSKGHSILVFCPSVSTSPITMTVDNLCTWYLSAQRACKYARGTMDEWNTFVSTLHLRYTESLLCMEEEQNRVDAHILSYSNTGEW